MKFVSVLKEVEIITLQELYKNGSTHRLRQRAHIILMSNKKFKIDTISAVTGLDRDTVSATFNKWESTGLIGLYDSKKSGRPSIFTDDEQKEIIQKIENNPRNIRAVAADINEQTNKKGSLDTVKRVLKKHKKVWKRMKKSTAKQPDNKLVEQAKIDLNDMQMKAIRGDIDLSYYDESGFTLTPYIPYAWQDIGGRIEITASRSKRINIAGFLNPYSNDLKAWSFECTINSDVVIALFDDVADSIKKETWVVLDNASFHCSDVLNEKIEEWKEKGLFLYYLPPYSPNLNLIERVWQFMKYKWIPLSAYLSIDHLRDAVYDLICGYGEKYLITFA